VEWSLADGTLGHSPGDASQWVKSTLLQYQRADGTMVSYSNSESGSSSLDQEQIDDDWTFDDLSNEHEDEDGVGGDDDDHDDDDETTGLDGPITITPETGNRREQALQGNTSIDNSLPNAPPNGSSLLTLADRIESSTQVLLRFTATSRLALEVDDDSAGGNRSLNVLATLRSNLTRAFEDQTFVRYLLASDPVLFSSESRSAPTTAILVGLSGAIGLIDSIDPDPGNNRTGSGTPNLLAGESVSFTVRELIIGIVVFVAITAFCVGSVFGGLWYLSAR